MLVLCIDNNFTDVHQGIHLVCRHTNEWRVRKKTEPDCFLLIFFLCGFVSCRSFIAFGRDFFFFFQFVNSSNDNKFLFSFFFECLLLFFLVKCKKKRWQQQEKNVFEIMRLNQFEKKRILNLRYSVRWIRAKKIIITFFTSQKISKYCGVIRMIIRTNTSIQCYWP